MSVNCRAALSSCRAPLPLGLPGRASEDGGILRLAGGVGPAVPGGRFELPLHDCVQPHRYGQVASFEIGARSSASTGLNVPLPFGPPGRNQPLSGGLVRLHSLNDEKERRQCPGQGSNLHRAFSSHQLDRELQLPPLRGTRPLKPGSGSAYRTRPAYHRHVRTPDLSGTRKTRMSREASRRRSGRSSSGRPRCCWPLRRPYEQRSPAPRRAGSVPACASP